MNGSAAGFLNGFMIAFVPGMMLFPLVFVLFVPTRVDEPEARDLARRRQLILGVFTFLAIAVWIGLTLIAKQTRMPIFEHSARMAWILFFPLWFGLGMPAVVAKNPAWGGACQPHDLHNTQVRTASLRPRNRENPLRAWHWALMFAVGLIPLVLLAARGAFPFEPAGPAADAARFRWRLITGIYALCTLVALPIVPFSIRKSLLEPEPLDSSGSPELESMYRTDRRKRILGLFWLLGVAQPLMLGLLFNAMIWGATTSGRTLGIAGAIGGTTIGLAGGVFGIIATLRRVRIAEERARLDAASKLR